MTLGANTQFGPYKILSPLGARAEWKANLF